MSVRPWVQLCALALLVLSFAPAAVAKTAAAPVLSVGDFWETRSHFASSPNTTLPDATARETVMALERITINGTAYDAVRTERNQTQSSSAGGFAFSTEIKTVSWSRASDGASLKTVTTTRSTSSFPGAPPPSESNSTTVYDPPCPGFPWPIAVGKTWTHSSSTCKSTTTSSDAQQQAILDQSQQHQGNYTTTGKVVREESATVPAGTFDTFVLEMNTTSNGTSTLTTMWYAPAVCNAVKSEYTGGPGSSSSSPQFSTTLLSFSCAHAGTASGTSSGTPPSATPVTTPGTAPTPTESTATATPATATAKGAPAPGAALVLASIAAALVVARRLPRR